MTRNKRSTAKPWWLVLLLMAIGWAYNRYFQPAPRSTRSNSSNTQRQTKRKTSSPTRATPKPNSVMAEGGVPFQDQVVRVTDGDTVKLAKQGTVRLIGVDCPEKAQSGGMEAKEFVTRALLNKTVEVELCAKQPTDRYGRSLGFIYVLDNQGQRILFNRELVRQGYARVYSLRPCTVDEAAWNADYETARAQRRGLFQTIGDVPDASAFRRSRRSTN